MPFCAVKAERKICFRNKQTLFLERRHFNTSSRAFLVDLEIQLKETLDLKLKFRKVTMMLKLVT